MTLVVKTLLSYHWRHPGQALFLFAGLISGLCLWVAVQVINDTARASYRDADRFLGLQMTHLITASGEGGVPVDSYIAMRGAGFNFLVPVIEKRLRSENGQYLNLVATDLFAVGNLNTRGGSGQGDTAPYSSGPASVSRDAGFSGDAWLAFVRPPYRTHVSAGLANTLNISTGDRIVTGAGIELPPALITDGNTGSLMLDIGAAFEIFKQAGFDYLAIINASQADVSGLKQFLNSQDTHDFELIANTEAIDLTQLTQSFHINLTAMSLLSVAVGLFIIYNAAQFSVLYRRASIRTMRACGVSLAQISAGLGIEFLLWIVAGSVVACLLGYWLGSALLPGVGITLNDLYGAAVSPSAAFRPVWIWQTLAMASVGMGCAVAMPMLQLLRTPITNQHAGNIGISDTGNTRKKYQYLFLILALAALGCLLLWRGSDLLNAFSGIAAFLLAGILCLPILLRTLADLGRTCLPDRCLMLRWLVSDIRLQLPRTQIAFIAVLLALVANIGVNLMVNSFRSAFTDWLDYRLASDIYIAGGEIDHTDIAGIDGISAVIRSDQMLVNWRGQTISLRGGDALDPSFSDIGKFNRFLAETDEDDQQILSQWRSGMGVLINEQMRHKAGITVGGELELSGPQGPVRYAVLGTVHDYGNTQFEVYLPSRELRRRWPESVLRGLGIILDGTAGEAAVIDALVATGIDPEKIRSQRSVKLIASGVFEQTFSITAALNSLTLLIAGISMLCALLSLQIERAGFLASLSSLGIRRNELIMGLLGGLLYKFTITFLLAVPLGYLLAWALVGRINILSFGWTMPLLWQGGAVINTLIVTLLVLLLSALPALWLIHRKPLRHWLAIARYAT